MAACQAVPESRPQRVPGTSATSAAGIAVFCGPPGGSPLTQQVLLCSVGLLGAPHSHNRCCCVLWASWGLPTHTLGVAVFRGPPGGSPLMQWALPCSVGFLGSPHSHNGCCCVPWASSGLPTHAVGIAVFRGLPGGSPLTQQALPCSVDLLEAPHSCSRRCRVPWASWGAPHSHNGCCCVPWASWGLPTLIFRETASSLSRLPSQLLPEPGGCLWAPDVCALAFISWSLCFDYNRFAALLRELHGMEILNSTMKHMESS